MRALLAAALLALATSEMTGAAAVVSRLRDGKVFDHVQVRPTHTRTAHTRAHMPAAWG